MIGKTILHYKIIEKLGEGGMGIVYLAEDSKLKRQVAIKFLPKHIASNSDERKRFEIEAQAAAALNHPNIATIHSIEEVDDEFFIVMEYIRGKHLKDHIASKELSVEEAIDIAIQTARGLQEAHNNGVVHRDIKSANIMSNEKSQVKIMDFGLAKVGAGIQLTQELSTLGTAAYMSPEQAKGEEVDHRSDIWSLGVVLYEMLTNSMPFRGDYEQAVIFNILNEEPSAPESKIPTEIELILQKALAKNPDDRYATAEMLLADLEQLKSESGISRLQSKIHLPKSIQRKRYPFMWPALVMALLLTIVLAYQFLSTGDYPLEKVPIAVVDFINKTSEPELNGLSGMLTTALEQSKRLSVITRSRMFDILKQLGKENVDYIDENLGREIAKHAGIKVLVLASIQKFDQLYNIDLKIINPIEEKYLFAASEKDEGKARIPEMVDRLAEKTREGLEESKEDIQLTAIPVAEITTPNLEAYQHYFKGQEYIEKIMFKKAEGEFEKAIGLDSTFGLAYYRLAYVLDWENNQAQSKIEIDNAYKYIDQIPEKEKHLVRFVKTLTDSGWGKAGLKILREMEKIYPDNKEMLYNIGDISYHIGDYEQAKTYLQKVLEMDSKSARAVEHLLWIYRDLGNNEQMLQTANKYVSVFSNTESYRFITSLCVYADNSQKIRELFSEAIKKHPNEPAIIYEIFIFLFDRRLHEHAALCLNIIQERWPDYWRSLPVSKSYGLRGHINMYPGKVEQAEKDFQRALELEPADKGTLRDFGLLLISLERYNEVRELSVKYEKLFSDNFFKAALYAVQGEKERALNINDNWQIYLLLKMKDEPLQVMSQRGSSALRTKTSYYVGFSNWPFYDFLRTDQRFQEILAQHKDVYDENLKNYGDLIDLIK